MPKVGNHSRRWILFMYKYLTAVHRYGPEDPMLTLLPLKNVFLFDVFSSLKQKHFLNIVFAPSQCQFMEGIKPFLHGLFRWSPAGTARALLSIMYSNPAYLCAHTPAHSPTQLLLLPGYQGCTHHILSCRSWGYRNGKQGRRKWFKCKQREGIRDPRPIER